MVSDDVYEAALPVLQNDALDDEDKTDKLEELLRNEAGLTGKPLETARGASAMRAAPRALRHRVAIPSSAAHPPRPGRQIAHPLPSTTRRAPSTRLLALASCPLP